MNHLAWLKLKSTPGIGNLLFKRLIDRFSSPEIVLKASRSDLCRVTGISDKLAASIRGHTIPREIIDDTERAIADGCRLVVMTAPDYPELLRQIPDPPAYLFVRGNIPPIPHIAIVGSRAATSYGLNNARRISSDLVSSGSCIVSGLARGIDTAAHKGALDCGGQTVAVLGCGMEHIYPPENRALAEQISHNGAVISEFPYSAPPDAKNFPMRNRIISGISLGTVVVEAADRSGSLITARLAAEQNREVFAIPGNINSYKSSGTHNLLKQGAKLVETTADILEELPPVFVRPADKCGLKANNTEPDVKNMLKNKIELDFDEMSVIKVLDLYPAHIDEITRRVSMDPGTLSGILLKLELKGIVYQSPGKLFSINEDVQ